MSHIMIHMTNSDIMKRSRKMQNENPWPGTTPLYMKGPAYTHLNESIYKKLTTLDPVMIRVIQKKLCLLEKSSQKALLYKKQNNPKMSNHFHPVDNVKSQIFSGLLPVLTGFTFISACIFIYAKMGF